MHDHLGRCEACGLITPEGDLEQRGDLLLCPDCQILYDDCEGAIKNEIK